MFDRIAGALQRIRGAEDVTRGGAKHSAGVECGEAVAFGEIRPKRVLLIVPEQYTLQAERNAFDHMDVPGFIDFEVLSLTSLGRRVIEETGGQTGNHINRYGKFMYLSRLLREKKAELQSFRNLERSTGFIDKLNDLITDLKNFKTSPDNLRVFAEALPEDSLLRRKLLDTAMIYKGYEEMLSGGQIDAADYLKLYTERIGISRFTAEAEIWLMGFDYLSPAALDAVTALALQACSVNFILTADAGLGRGDEECVDPRSKRSAMRHSDAGLGRGDEECVDPRSKRSVMQHSDAGLGRGDEQAPPRDTPDPIFAVTVRLMKKLSTAIRAAGQDVRSWKIPTDYAHVRPPEISRIERMLFSYTDERSPGADRDGKGNGPPSLRLVAAANYYTEAETAAAEIARLIQDEGLRYRDILVLCNDMQTRGPIIKRVFQRYGLPIFMDQRRGIAHDPVPEYILALPEIIAGGWRYEDIFRWLKTGLFGIERRDIEILENYAFEYKIRGGRWKRPFKLGEGRWDLDALNAIRLEIAEFLSAFEKTYKQEKTARGKTEQFHRFLIQQARLPDAADLLAQELETSSELEYAAEISGIWDAAVDVFSQMSSVLGDISLNSDEYAVILRAGFEAIKMGVLPTTSDQIILGTLQRTRSGKAKVLLVLGANDGLMPKAAVDDGLLNEDELRAIAEVRPEIGRSSDEIIQEEQLAIYRNLSKPSHRLYVSYSVSGSDGRDMKPSIIYRRLCRLFPEVREEKDILNQPDGDPLQLVRAPREALGYLTENLLRDVEFEGGAPLAGSNQVPAGAFDKKPDVAPGDHAPGSNALSDAPGSNASDVARGDHALGSNASDVARGDHASGSNASDVARGDHAPGSNASDVAPGDHASGYVPGGRDIWRDVYLWFFKNMPEKLKPVKSGLLFENRRERIDTEILKALRGGRDILTTSPSALERYSRCPFAWFMERGIRLKERRPFEMDSRNVGEVMHGALMAFGQAMASDGLAPQDERSRWQTASDEEIRQIVETVYTEVTRTDQEGLFADPDAEAGTSRDNEVAETAAEIGGNKTNTDAGTLRDNEVEETVAEIGGNKTNTDAGTSRDNEVAEAVAEISVSQANEKSEMAEGETMESAEYEISEAIYTRYKSERIKDVVTDAAKALVQQIREGRVVDMRFEAAFGPGAEFDAISATEGVEILGRIDRVDILEGGYARIIDYKSGSDRFSMADVRGGWQLQLMLYMKAVSERYKPAGVYYFKILEPHIEMPHAAEDAGTQYVTGNAEMQYPMRDKEIRYAATVDAQHAGEDAGLQAVKAAPDLDAADALIMKAYKLDGVGAEGEGLAFDTDEGSETSRKPRNLLAADEFSALCIAVDETARDLSRRMSAGDTAAHPKAAVMLKDANGRKLSACTWCAFRGICNYDQAFN